MEKNKFKMEDINVETRFFCITEEDLKKYGVTNTDSVEEVKQKIYNVVTQDSYLYNLFNKDPLVWEIANIEIGCWTTPVKEEKIIATNELKNYGYTVDATKPIKESILKQSYQQKISVKFKKREKTNTPSPEAIKKMCEELEKPAEFIVKMDKIMSYIYAKKDELEIPNTIPKLGYDPNKLFIVPDVELHLGKLSSYFETDDPYTYKKAIYRYQHAIKEAIKTQDMYRAEEVIMTIGQDFYNIDNVFGQTSAGTPQTNDSRYQQLVITGQQMHIWAIDEMKKHAKKIRIAYQQGNHDALIDATLMVALKNNYRNDPQVEISMAPEDLRVVTVYIWNGELIIFVHGKAPDGKPLNDKGIKEVVAKAQLKYAGQYTHISVIMGHLHTTGIKSENNMTVYRCGSSTGDASWEESSGYRSDKTSNALLLEKDRGCMGFFSYKLTEEELKKAVNVPSCEASTDYFDLINDTLLKADTKMSIEKAKSQLKLLNTQKNNLKKACLTKIKKLINANSNISNTDDTIEDLLKFMGYYDETKEIDEAIDILSKYIEQNAQNIKFKVNTKKKK